LDAWAVTRKPIRPTLIGSPCEECFFTNAHCQGPICGPSRASLLSGLFPHTTGVYDQPSVSLWEDPRFKGKLLPQYFARHGYHTMGVGKIPHGYPLDKVFVEAGPKGNSGPKPGKGKRFNYHLPDVPWTGTQTDWGEFPDADSKMPDYQTAEWAIEKLGRKYDKPFFLGVGFHRPHVPFYVPSKWFERFPIDEIRLPLVRNDDLEDVPEISRRLHEVPKYPKLDFLQADNNKQFKLCVQAYLACTAFVDFQVGRVLRALEQSDYADNTVIVLFSDHGYHLGEKNRVSKHSLWEEATRVPMVIVRPRDTHARSCNQPVGLIDLYPTLTDLCGLPPVATNEGRSLRPLFSDPQADWRTAISTTYARGNHALRSTRYRYIRFDDGSEELYDHANDPQEWTNLAGREDMEAVIEEHRQQLPATNAPYHASVRMEAINSWYAEHFKRSRP
jgi:arylsulfatase A-like enzyme